MEKALALYNETKKQLLSIAKESGVTDLEKYYSQVDFHENSNLRKYMDGVSEETSKIFIQLAFHAQNSKSNRLSVIVKFYDNYEKIKKVCCNFKTTDFIDNYSDEGKRSNQEAIIAITDAFYSEGINWKRNNKHNTQPSVEVMFHFSRRLWYGAKFIDQFSKKSNPKQAIEEALWENSKGSDVTYPVRNFIKYTKDDENRNTFGIALACDFLKEFSTKFENLAKPDVHIKDVIDAFNGTTTRNDDYQYLRDMNNIVTIIQSNATCPEHKELTVYKLDRMMWLICTGDFFLDFSENRKARYLDAIVKLKKMLK